MTPSREKKIKKKKNHCEIKQIHVEHYQIENYKGTLPNKKLQTKINKNKNKSTKEIYQIENYIY